MSNLTLAEKLPFPGGEEALSLLSSRVPAALYGMSDGQRAFFACQAALKTGRPVLFVCAGETAAMKAAEDCSALNNVNAAFLPSPEVRFIRATAGRERMWQRLNILSSLRRGNIQVLCASAEALQTPMMPPAEFDRACISLQVGSEYDISQLLRQLVENGYERSDMVEGKGQCAQRGAILDVFPPDLTHALRIEFFDTEVDSIRAFDCISQRSLDRLDAVTLCPAAEHLISPERRAPFAQAMRAAVEAHSGRLPKDALLPTLPPLPQEEDTPEEGEKKRGRKKANAEVKKPLQEEETPDFGSTAVPRMLLSGPDAMLDDAKQAENGLYFDQLPLWAGMLYPDFALICDYLRDGLILMNDPEKARGRCDDRMGGFSLELKTALERGEAVPEMLSAMVDWESLKSRLAAYAPITMQDFLHGMSGIEVKKIL